VEDNSAFEEDSVNSALPCLNGVGVNSTFEEDSVAAEADGFHQVIDGFVRVSAEHLPREKALHVALVSWFVG